MSTLHKPRRRNRPAVTKIPTPRPEPDQVRVYRALTRHFELTDRILTGKDIECRLDMNTSLSSPAYTLEKQINFCYQKMPTYMNETKNYIVMSGLNSHELGHVLFTPSTRQMRKILLDAGEDQCLLPERIESDSAVRMAFNILEDQRIETLIVARYRAMRHYLIAAFLYYIVRDTSQRQTAFLFSRGRRYLPVKLRRTLRQMYKNQKQVPDIIRIIDSYRTLNLTTAKGIIAAEKLIDEFRDILCDVGGVTPKDAHRVCSHNKQRDTEESVSEREQRDALKAAKRAEGDFEDEDADSGDDIDSTDGDAADEDGDAAEGDAPGDGDETDSDDTAGDGAGDGKSDGADMSSTDLLEVADDIFKAIQGEAEIQEDIKAMDRAVRNAPPVSGNTEIKHRKMWFPVPDECHPIVKQTVDALRAVEMDLDPYWMTHRDAGRLNVQRAMRAHPTDEGLWDEWHEGGVGGTSIEMAVLLDISSSMDGQRRHLSNAAWIIKRASDIMRIRTSILLYNAEKPELLFGPTDAAQPTHFCHIETGGGTRPAPALVDALHILAASKRQKKVMLIMTDGDWNITVDTTDANERQYESADDIIAKMNGLGIVTAMVAMGFLAGSWHNCMVRGYIKSMRDFPQYVRELLVKEMRRPQR